MFTTSSITIEIPEGLLEDVEAEFDVSLEKSWLEPYSWGQSRGFETEVNAELISAQIGGLKLTRYQIVAMLSEPEALAIEEKYVENNRDDLIETAIEDAA